MDKENLLKKAETNETPPEQKAQTENKKFNLQLGANELAVLGKLATEILSRLSPEKARFFQKAYRALEAVTAGALIVLSTIGPSEAWAGGNKPGKIGGEGLSSGKVKAEQVMTQQDQEERENPNITINGKPAKAIDRDGDGTFYGDEKSSYSEKNGNTSISGGVYIGNK